MNERPRSVATPDIPTPARRLPRRGRRADRALLAAAALSSVALVAGAASAWAGSSGGIGGGIGVDPVPDGYVATPGCPDREFGRRTLRFGDCGGDVETLNWLLKAEAFRAVPAADRFKSPTADAVRSFQRRAKIAADGVVDARTSAALAGGMLSQRATWYGPGFFGNETACGRRLTRQTTGVAHKTLPCGSKVVIRYRGSYARTTVIDRGPYANGAKWDLTQATARQLGLVYTDEIRVAKIPKRKPKP